MYDTENSQSSFKFDCTEVGYYYSTVRYNTILFLARQVQALNMGQTPGTSHTWPSTHKKHPLQWRHNAHDSVSNHQPRDCLLNRLTKRRSKKTSKLRVTGLCAENSPGTGEFPAQMASNAENVSIWWRHHARGLVIGCPLSAMSIVNTYCKNL